MSDPSLDRHAVLDALNQPDQHLAALGPAEQLEQARDHLLVERGNAARALDPSPWLDKHNTRMRQENAEVHLRRRGPFFGNFFTSECVGYVNRAALALACLAGWEWAWRQLVVQHRTVLFDHNKHFATQTYTAVSACATLSEASKAAWEWLLQTTGCASPLMNPWAVEDVHRIWRTDPQRLLQTFAQCSPLFSAAGKPCLEVNRGTEIEIEAIRRSNESTAPAPAPTDPPAPPSPLPQSAAIGAPRKNPEAVDYAIELRQQNPKPSWKDVWTACRSKLTDTSQTPKNFEHAVLEEEKRRRRDLSD
jgi:hypothetical protein